MHSFGREARIAIENAREQIAKILNCSAEEIFFTGTTTTSDNLAILGAVGWGNKGNKGEMGNMGHLITTQIEHHAVLDTFKQLEREGFEVTYLPVDKYGVVDLKALEEAIRPETRLVSIMYANNEVGTVQSIEEISNILKGKRGNMGKTGEKGDIYFHTDAAATVEYLDLDVQKLGVDLMTLGSHKFGGPKGVGILYVKKGTKINPITFGGHHEGGLFPGTEATPLIVGMTKALEIVKLPNCELRINEITRLRDKLIKGILEKVERVILTGHPENRLADIASFIFEGVEGEAVLLKLDSKGIAVSSGSACTSGDLKPSHVLLAMRIPQEEAHGSIRFSLGRETTEEEIDYVLEVLPAVIEDIRKMAPKI
jgi:cysteine desulfurase